MIALIHLGLFLGSNSKEAQMFAKLLSDASEIDDPKILFMSSKRGRVS